MLEKLRKERFSDKCTTHRCDTGGYLEAYSLRSTNLFHLLAPEIQTEHVIYALYRYRYFKKL